MEVSTKEVTQMTFEEIQNRIKDEVYNPEYPTDNTYENRRAWRKACEEAGQKFRDDLVEASGLGEAARKLVDYAWELGHADGYTEVLYIFRELLDAVQPILDATKTQ
jgi:hypothetical protein